jgi:hypothetical protein
LLLGVSGVNGDIPNQAVTVNKPATGSGDDLKIETSHITSCVQKQETFQVFWQDNRYVLMQTNKILPTISPFYGVNY